MVRKLKLVFGLHLHQPAGNFLEVFENNYERAYLPFLKVFYKFSHLKLVFHSSGILFKWLVEEKKEFRDILEKLVKEGRVEILTGGFYEPIFPAISERDRLLQIKKLSDFIEKYFNFKPEGLWLAERVWEPHIISSLKKAGINYVLLDDYHLLSSGVSKNKMDGYYLTEEVENLMGVFPIDEGMRYLTPWALVEKVEEFLRGEFDRGRKLIVVVDDGEKFGGWPETYRWVYKEGWLEKFFEMVERNSSWLETETLSSFFCSEKATGKVIIPSNSYIEMGEWALPPEEALKFSEIKDRLKEWGVYEENKSFLRGSIWRNFLIKYGESNIINKLGNFLSREMESKGITGDKLLDKLLESQCNDVYWHGVFGGIYLPHLRENSYRCFRDIFSGLDKFWEEEDFCPGFRNVDLDLDGEKEFLINTDESFLVIKERSGEIPIWYDKKSGVNFFDVVARYRERYHIKNIVEGAVLLDRDKKITLPDLMGFDERPRWGNRKYFVENGIDLDSLIRGNFQGLTVSYEKGEIFKEGDDFKLFFKSEGISEEISFFKKGSYFKNTITNESNRDLLILYDLSLLTFKDTEKWFTINGIEKFGVGKKKTFHGVRNFSVVDGRRGFKILVEADVPFSLFFYPVITYSLNVDRIDSTYQGLSISMLFKDFKFSYTFKIERV